MHRRKTWDEEPGRPNEIQWFHRKTSNSTSWYQSAYSLRTNLEKFIVLGYTVQLIRRVTFMHWDKLLAFVNCLTVYVLLEYCNLYRHTIGSKKELNVYKCLTENEMILFLHVIRRRLNIKKKNMFQYINGNMLSAIKAVITIAWTLGRTGQTPIWWRRSLLMVNCPVIGLLIWIHWTHI